MQIPRQCCIVRCGVILGCTLDFPQPLGVLEGLGETEVELALGTPVLWISAEIDIISHPLSESVATMEY